MVVDTSTNFSSLKMQWASKANCKQRAGRAGRLSSGRVYRMVSKYFYTNYLYEYSEPEMLRCPLETVILKAKLLELGPPTDVLSLAMDPPNLLDVTNTILTLKEIGALYTHVNGQYKVQDGDLTFIGRIMAALPIDVHLSRLVVLGYMFSVLEDTIIMAAALSVRSIFKYPIRQKEKEAESHIRKLLWADGTGSDLIAICRAYKCWLGNREQHSVMEESESIWARRFYIDLRSLKEMYLLVQEIKERLEAVGIKEQSSYQRVFWFDREKNIILKVVIAGAFYPNYFIHSKVNDIDHDRGINHILNGNDALSTVYFTKFDSFRIGQLYIRSIKSLFKGVLISPKNIQIRFQPGSQRVFATFVDNDEDEKDGNRLTVPGIIRPEIFKALLLRSMKLQCTIPVLESKYEGKYAEERNLGVMNCGQWVSNKSNILNPDLMVLPTLFVENVRGYITHVESCTKFFFQPLSEMERLREIRLILNDSDESKTIRRYEYPSNISIGMHLSAPFDGENQRAKVLSAICSTRRHVQFKVLFIDYGVEKVVEFETLRPYPHRYMSVLNIPPRVFECRLAHIQPSELHNNNNSWADGANDILKEISNSGIVSIKIFSLVDKLANVEIHSDNGGLHEILVHKELARKSEESYASKMDHDTRRRKQAVSRCLSEDDIAKENLDYLNSIQLDLDVEVDPPPADICTKTVTLKGPFSPLEVKVFSATRAGAWKNVLIERDSINNILLDTDPYDLHERLVVAASVSENQNGDSLTARCTTIMPNIHGFSALMTLLFCPRVQIKCNKQRTKFVSILAGLGFDEETQEPLYEEHDIVLNLDVDLLPADIELINQIRYCMDSIIYTDPDDSKLSVPIKQREDLSAKIKSLLIRLLNKNRDYIETQKNFSDNEWQKFDDADLLSVNDVYGHRTIFPMHSILNLCTEKFESMHALGLHCKELYEQSNFGGYINPITCRLCNQLLENINQLRLHLLSQLHLDREKQINFKMH
ncbi:probable ATP-dependent RNA helicase spindle-E [Teleopsis dalmanni]|nr:probable ATP-dependent RNA helicase spindle-E [Teleopsis dalmanni]